jgi:hypothetical protein
MFANRFDVFNVKFFWEASEKAWKSIIAASLVSKIIPVGFLEFLGTFAAVRSRLPPSSPDRKWTRRMPCANAVGAINF